MTKNLNKELKQYYHEIGKFLSCDNRKKKNILGLIKTSVECYLSDNPNSTIDDIIKNFGSPKDISCEYYNNENPEEITANIKKSKKIVMCVVATLCFALLIYIAVIVTALINDINSTASYSETVFTETSQSDIVKGE